jgi:acyl-coenzyme A thioesterase 7
MRPDDANVAGNVHGGTILKMIEEAGAIISTRHCNSQDGVSTWALALPGLG